MLTRKAARSQLVARELQRQLAMADHQDDHAVPMMINDDDVHGEQKSAATSIATCVGVQRLACQQAYAHSEIDSVFGVAHAEAKEDDHDDDEERSKLFGERMDMPDDGDFNKPLDTTAMPEALFVDIVPSELICCVCSGVADDPATLEPCSHIVCRDCILQDNFSGMNKEHCPDCMVNRVRCARSMPIPLTKSPLPSNPVAQSLLWQLRVSCPHDDDDDSLCGWQDVLGIDCRNLIQHDATCPHALMQCMGCFSEFERREFEAHYRACENRDVQCMSCRWDDIPLNKFHKHQPAYATRTVLPAGGSMKNGMCASVNSTDIDVDVTIAAEPIGLLPPRIPPCVEMEACPNKCEDGDNPGHVSVYKKSSGVEHRLMCKQRPVLCTFCSPHHMLLPSELAQHAQERLSEFILSSTRAHHAVRDAMLRDEVQCMEMNQVEKVSVSDLLLRMNAVAAAAKPPVYPFTREEVEERCMQMQRDYVAYGGRRYDLGKDTFTTDVWYRKESNAS